MTRHGIMWPMSGSAGSSYCSGETALIARVPEAEPVVGGWRSRYDAAAVAGVPAHITVLYPFQEREAPPYGGRFADVVPHLTVADGQEAQVLDMIEAEVVGQLPVGSHIGAIALIAFDGCAWREEHSFALADA